MGVFVNQNAGICRRRGWALLSLDWLCRLDAVLVLAAMLTGCTVGPDFQTPSAPDVTGYLPHMGSSRSALREAVPGAAFMHGAYISDRWWELLHSRHLNELIRSALIHNADLQAAESAVRVAQANA